MKYPRVRAKIAQSCEGETEAVEDSVKASMGAYCSLAGQVKLASALDSGWKFVKVASHLSCRPSILSSKSPDPLPDIPLPSRTHLRHHIPQVSYSKRLQLFVRLP